MDQLEVTPTHDFIRQVHALDVDQDQFHDAAVHLFSKAINVAPGGVGPALPAKGEVDKRDGTSDYIAIISGGMFTIKTSGASVDWQKGVMINSQSLVNGKPYDCILTYNPNPGFVIYTIGTTDSGECAFGYYFPMGVPVPTSQVQRVKGTWATGS